MIYGISRLEAAIDVVAVAAIVTGLIAAAGFIAWELRTPEPALDLRIFRSGRFNAAVTAGVMFNFLAGGAMIVFAFYLVTVRGESPQVLGLLLIPATALAALAATAAGPAATRFGDRTVLVGGLGIMLVGLLLLRTFDESTSLAMVFAAVVLNVVGGAFVGTPQATIMMASAPAELGGAVWGSKALSTRRAIHSVQLCSPSSASTSSSEMACTDWPAPESASRRHGRRFERRTALWSAVHTSSMPIAPEWWPQRRLRACWTPSTLSV